MYYSLNKRDFFFKLGLVLTLILSICFVINGDLVYGDSDPVTVSVAPGTVAASAQLNLTPVNSDDTFQYIIGSSPLAVAPDFGDPAPIGGVAYNPGDNIVGMDADVNKYLDVYELDSNGTSVVAFSELTINPNDLSVPALSIAPNAAPGTAGGCVRLNLTPNDQNDSFEYIIGTSPLGTYPAYGDNAPAGTAYTSGNNINGVDPDGFKYVDIYEVSPSNAMQAFSEITLSASDIAAPAMGTDPSAAPGTIPGSTQLTLVADTFGNTFKVNIVSAPAAPLPDLGSTPPGAPYTSGSNLTGVDGRTNKYADIYEFDAFGKFVNFSEIMLAATDITAPPISIAPVALPGTASSSVKLNVTPNDINDTFLYTLGTSAIGTLPVGGAVAPAGTAFTSGDNLSGADPVSKKYLDIYEVSSGNVIEAFNEIVLNSGEITGQLMGTPPSAAPGTVSGSTKLALTADAPGCTFKIDVSNQSINIPVLSTSAGTPYISGSNITGVDPVNNKYVDVYEYDSSGDFAYFYEVTLSGSDIAVLPFTIAPAAAPGTVGGSTSLTLTPLDSDDTFLYVIMNSALGFIPGTGSVAPNGTAYTSGDDIIGVDPVNNRYIDVYEVSGTSVQAFKEIVLDSSVISAPAMGTPPLAAAGTVPGSTSLALVKDAQGDTFKVNVVSQPTGFPALNMVTGTVYTSGRNITGVDPANNKYVDVYELDSSGSFVGFAEVALVPGDISAPDFITPPVAAPGTVGGSTRLTLVPNDIADTFLYVVASSPLGALPDTGSAAPAGTDYTSGDNITGVDPTSDKYLDIYELSGTNVAAFKEITLTSADITALSMGTAPTVAPGTVAGSIQLTLVTDEPGATFKVNVASSATVLPSLGPAVGSAYVSGHNITGVDLVTNKYVDVYELNASGKFTYFYEIMLSAGDVTAPTLTVAPVAAPGTVGGSTKLTLVPNDPADTFEIDISNIPIAALPTSGSNEPVGAFSYTSGSDITSLDPTTSNYLDIYEVSGTTVTAFKEIKLTASSITAPDLGTAPVVAPGLTAGSIKLTLVKDSNGYTFKVNIVSKVTSLPGVGSAPSGTAYTSDSDLTGADPVAKKYIDIYEIDSAGKVERFSEVTLTADQITVPAIINAPIALPGTVQGSTKLTLRPNDNADTFIYVIGTSPISALPVTGADAPAGTAYTSNSDITGVDASSHIYLDIYEVSGTTVVAFREVKLVPAQITAPAMGTAPTVAPGTAAGTIKLTLTPDVPGSTFKVNVVTKSIAFPNNANTPPGALYVSGNDIKVTDTATYRYVDVYEMDSKGKTAYFTEITLTDSVITVPVIKSSVVIATGSAAGSTKLTLKPNNAPDTFQYIISASPIGTLPALGSAAPGGGTPYTSGSNIIGVDPTSNKYLDIYEVSGTSVQAFKEIVLTASQIAAPAMGTLPTAAPGTVAGSVQLTLTADSAGNTFKVNIVSKPSSAPATGSSPQGTAYVSGSNKTGVDAVTKKYVDVYELDSKGKTAYYAEITLAAGDITAPTFGTAPKAAPGSTPGSIKLTLVPLNKADTFQYIISSSPIGTLPVTGEALPNGCTAYVSGSSITGVDAATNKFVDIYEVNGTSVVAFKEITLTPAQITAPGLGTVPTAAPGTVAGSTQLTLAADAGGVSFKVSVSNKPVSAPSVGKNPQGTAYTSGNNITGVDAVNNKYVNICELDSLGKVAYFSVITLSASDITAPALKTPKAAPGTVAGSTKLTLSPLNKADTFLYIVGNSPIGTLPVTGSAAPAGTAYVSGGNITGVDPVSDKYLDVYELSGGTVAAFKEITLLPGQITAPGMGTAPTASPGTAAGSTQLTLSADVSGYTFKINAVCKPATLPAMGSSAPGSAYTSGSNKTGVDPTTNKYIDVYELDSSGKIAYFSEIRLTAGEITAPSFKTAPTAAAGTAPGSTKLTVKPLAASDTIQYVISSSAIASLPVSGSAFSSGTAYTSGSNITGVDPTVNCYIDIYDLSGTSVVAFKEIMLTPAQIAAPDLDTAPSASPGSVAGSTQLSLTPNNSGDTFKVAVVSRAATTIPAIGKSPSGSAYTSGADIIGVNPTTKKYVDIYELDSSGKIVSFTEVTLSGADIK